MTATLAPAVDYGDPRLPERFWIKVYPCPITGCWLWGAGVVSARSGTYGKFWWEGATHVAHRLLYRLLVGEPPPEWEVDHTCRQRMCVNPAHLEAVPQRVNWERSNQPAAVRARLGHCAKGEDHELRPARDGRGRPFLKCHTCRMNRDRARSGATPRPIGPKSHKRVA